MMQRPNLLAFSLTLLSLALLPAIPVIVSSSSPRPDWASAIRREVPAVMPPAAVSCGFVGLMQDSFSADACMAHAAAARVDHWVASQAQGEDSIVWIAVLRTSDGRLRRYDFDSYGWSQRPHADRLFTRSVVPCRQLQRRAEAHTAANGPFASAPAFDCPDKA